MRKAFAALALLGLFLSFHARGAPLAAGAAGSDHGHGGPVVPVLLGLVIILGAAKLGGELFERLGQPAVLGELLFGMVLGNLSLVGFGGFSFLATDPGLEILAQLGVILLLFQVGLESNVREMMSVGWSSLLVAVLGVIAPFFLGWGVSAWLLPKEETLAHLFIGATLCATSVGITARVLKDLGKTSTRESKIILGAAVIDDVLGLVILSVVAGTIAAANTGGSLDALDALGIVGKAIAFLVGALLIGGWLSRHVFRLASNLRIQGLLLALSLGACFLLSYLADRIGLAAIVGAFAAGLILDGVSYRDLGERTKHTIEELIHPIAGFLVPVFFVLMGVRVDLASFGHPEVLGFAALLSLAAILGKMICAAGVLERGLDRASVAVGMVPRGEVGLIFAGIGAQLVLHGQRVIPPPVFAAVVVMVIVTTLVTPPSLQWTLNQGGLKAWKREALRQARLAEEPADRQNPRVD
ncbi:MAG TPA: cation:proton antiporter [Thermoanaerobaculia bacterium]|jgi:Kef-type K+ transport system membrane component KefB|nr:cation:proton antiporter [Thermoanaerobaculia bacterium]